jgi:hypothetical protein
MSKMRREKIINEENGECHTPTTILEMEKNNSRYKNEFKKPVYVKSIATRI